MANHLLKPHGFYDDLFTVGHVASVFSQALPFPEPPRVLLPGDGLKVLEERLHHCNFWLQQRDFPKDRYFFVYHNGKVLVANDYVQEPEGVDFEARLAERYWEQVAKLDVSSAGLKAMDLLKEFLSEGQRDDLDKKGMFFDKLWTPEVVLDSQGNVKYYGPAPGTTGFVLRYQLPGPVIKARRLPRGKQIADLCWHPEEPLPSADIVLAHLLASREDPQAYFKQANW